MANSQRKGRDAELELTKILQGYGFPVKVGMPVNCGRTADIVNLRGCHVEVKRREHLNLSEAMKQSEADAERFKDGLPLVIHRRSREAWQVTMKLSDWVKLYAIWELYSDG